jgi:uncharacterized protein (TIGR02145 family)
MLSNLNKLALATLCITLQLLNCTEHERDNPNDPSGEGFYGSLLDSRDGQEYKTVAIGGQVWMAEDLKHGGAEKYDYETALTVCPSGWYLPSYLELKVLNAFAGNFAGTKLSSNGTDIYGFSASDGYNYWTSTDDFGGDNAYFWFASENNDSITSVVRKNTLCHVRCLQNQKCGDVDYNPNTQACENGDLKPKCGNYIYDAATQFCSAQNGNVYAKCGGSAYNTTTQFCDNGAVQAMQLCGSAYYNPTAMFCSEQETIMFRDSRDGNEYRITTIGNQVWFAENLNYNDNTNGSKCYDNQDSNCDSFGRLYNWEAAKLACPSGWHLPSNEEWDRLYRYADGTNGTSSPYNSPTAGKYLKATSGWYSNGNGEDTYGFAALPEGSGNASTYGRWWSASEYNSVGAYSRYMHYYNGEASWDSPGKSSLRGVRCLQD